MEFRKITVSGTPYKMGYTFGNECKNEIYSILDDALKTSSGEKLSKSIAFKPLYERYFPDMLEEARGIGDAVGISLDESLLLQTRWDLELSPANECTSFACAGIATKDSRVFSGMNKDVTIAARDMMVLVHMLPENAPGKLLVAYPGSMAGPGMNECGVCFFGNALYGGRPRKNSIPQPMMMRIILEQKTAKDAKDKLLGIHSDGHLGFSGNATICDAIGDMYCVEMFGDQIAVANANKDKGYLVHANNLITNVPSMLEIEHPELSGNTIGRTSRMAELFELHHGRLDEEILKGVLRDHEGGAFAICRHNGCREGREPSFTAMSCVAMPNERKVWFCKGNPCENPYKLYEL